MYDQIASQEWQTPLVNMTIEEGKAHIPEVPILSTGQWKGTLVAEQNLEEVVEWQKEQGPIRLVQDHLEDTRNFAGLADNYRIVEDPRGFKVIVADLEVVDEALIKKLALMKEKGGGFAGISPRIDWKNKDEDGNVEVLTTPHVSIVLHPAQGQITELSATVLTKEEGMTAKDKFTQDDLQKKAEEEEKKKKEEEERKKKEEEEKKKKMQAEKKIKCPCGEEVPVGEKCPKCGAKLEDNAVVPAIVAEAEQIIANDKADVPALKGFLERLIEEFQKKEKKYPPYPKGKQPYKYPSPKGRKEGEDESTGREVYALPTKREVKALGENRWEKELLPQGLFAHPSGFGLLPVGDAFLEALIKNTKELFGEKQIPVFIGHPKGEESADKTVGWLGGFKKNKSLFGTIEITNSLVKDAIDDTTLRDASIGVCLDFINEEGRNMGAVITHLALTNTPYFRKLEGFKKLVASDVDVEVAELEPVDGGLVDKATMESIATIKEQFEEVSKNYADILKKVVHAKKEESLAKLDKLVEAYLIRPGAKERFAEFIEKTSGTQFDERRSVAEVVMDLLETGLLKQTVNMSTTLSVVGEGERELVTPGDFKKYNIAQMIRTGRISHNQNGRPFWTEKGRPEDE